MGWLGQTHWRILVALGFGLVWGVAATFLGLSGFTGDWIAPFGTIFLRLLLLIAVPLVLASLVTGVASLANLQKLSRIGGKTIAIYLGTTLVALVIGLLVVNVVEPGTSIPESLRLSLQEAYQGDVEERQATAEQMERGPLQPLVDMVPDNIFSAASNNRSMLSVVFSALLLGVALMLLPREQAQPLLSLFESVNAAIIKIVEIILVVAPVGVFSLIAGTITSVAGDNPSDVAQLLGALGLYCLCVLVGLAIHAFLTYPQSCFEPSPRITPFRFLRGVVPAQLVAFSTSSSAATLPVSMETAEHNLGVSEEVTSFVLPLGATINMDGTAVYMSVAAVFIAQTLGIGLDLAAQATIVFTALLASIGTAAVPSAGIVMLVIVLEAIGVPVAGIALIFGVDRILDMCRTMTNVTGDLTVAAVVGTSEGQLTATAMNGLGGRTASAES